MRPLSAAQEKLIRQLHSAHSRKKTRFLLVEGIRGVETMLQAGINPEFIVISPADLTQPGHRFVENLDAETLPLVECDTRRFKPLTDAVVGQGVLAVAAETELPSANDRWPQAKLVVQLDQVSDPGNLGTIIRTAAGCGVDIIALSPGSADATNPKVIRASAGTIFLQPVVRLSGLETFFGQLQSNNIALWGSDARAGTPLDRVETGMEKVCLAFGSEADGLSEMVRAACAGLFRLPIAEKVESFNVAASAAIAIHAVSRRMRLI